MKDCLLPIDFTDPGVIMHHNSPIPINTQEKYEAIGRIMEAQYQLRGLNAVQDPDAWQQLRQRVLSGHEWPEIQDRVESDLDARYPATKQE